MCTQYSTLISKHIHNVYQLMVVDYIQQGEKRVTCTQTLPHLCVSHVLCEMHLADASTLRLAGDLHADLFLLT